MTGYLREVAFSDELGLTYVVGLVELYRLDFHLLKL